MPGWRLSMRKIREVLRLKFEQNLTNRQIALSCNISRPSVAQYLARTMAAGLSWPLPEELDHATLEHLLFPSAGAQPTGVSGRPSSDLDMQHIHLHFLVACLIHIR